MLKKMMLLAGAAVALIAFALPAVASADEWRVNGVDPGGSTATGKTVVGHGELTATQGTIRLGPCPVTTEVRLWNDQSKATATKATGEVLNLTIDATGPECEAYKEEVTECDIVSASANTLAPPSGPGAWPITTEGTEASIGNANFTDVFNSGCPLGPGAGASGTATGTLTAGGAITFSGSGDLSNVNGPVTLDGEVELTGVTLVE